MAIKTVGRGTGHGAVRAGPGQLDQGTRVWEQAWRGSYGAWGIGRVTSGFRLSTFRRPLAKYRRGHCRIAGSVDPTVCGEQGRMLGGTVAGEVIKLFTTIKPQHRAAGRGRRFTGGGSRTPPPSALVTCPARNVRPLKIACSRRLCPPRARTACARACALLPPRLERARSLPFALFLPLPCWRVRPLRPPPRAVRRECASRAWCTKLIRDPCVGMVILTACTATKTCTARLYYDCTLPVFRVGWRV